MNHQGMTSDQFFHEGETLITCDDIVLILIWVFSLSCELCSRLIL